MGNRGNDRDDSRFGSFGGSYRDGDRRSRSERGGFGGSNDSKFSGKEEFGSDRRGRRDRDDRLHDENDTFVDRTNRPHKSLLEKSKPPPPPPVAPIALPGEDEKAAKARIEKKKRE